LKRIYRQFEAINLEIFDCKTGDIVRSLKGCAGPAGDVVRELHINTRGTHAVSFCTSPVSGVSYIACWGLDTSDHKHVARHNKVQFYNPRIIVCFAAVSHFILTDNTFIVIVLKAIVLKKA